jgi:hypothetical protein
MPYQIIPPSRIIIDKPIPSILTVELLADAVFTANRVEGSAIHNGVFVVATSPTTVQAIQERHGNEHFLF